MRLGGFIFICGLMHRMHPKALTSERAAVGRSCFSKRILKGQWLSKQQQQQQATSLSSCESELYSTQQAAQDAVALSKVLQRLPLGIGETMPDAIVNILLESGSTFVDSTFALQLIHGVDILKKVDTH